MTAVTRMARRFAAALMIVVGMPLAASAAPITVASLGFGSVPIDTLVTENVAVAADSGFSLQAISLAGSGLSFGDPLACISGLGCAIDFLPTTLGPIAQGSLAVTECESGTATCTTTSIPVTGAGISVLAISPSPIDFGMVALNTLAVIPATFTLDAGFSLQAISLAGIALSFGDPLACISGPSCPIDFLPTALGPIGPGSLAVTECKSGTTTCLSASAPVTGIGTLASAIPEPGALALFGPSLALGWLAGRRTRRSRTSPGGGKHEDRRSMSLWPTAAATAFPGPGR